MIFNYDEAFQASKEYFNGDELAAKVFLDKYALRNADGELVEKTPYDMHVRIAKELARIEEKKYNKPMTFEEIFPYLDRFERIVPQGSVMFGCGNYHQYSTLSNCYVVESPLDSYAAIMRADEQLVQISKRRGGVGIDISNIRPAKSRTNNAARTSTGVEPFMCRFSNSIREVGQDGRRGALMLSISIHHPEVLDFARSKLDKTRVTGANISIRLTDEFLEAVQNNTDYEQRWPVDSKTPIISKKVNAREVWKEIIHLAWSTAEPGLLFWCNIIRESPADCYFEFGFETKSTNPCSELPLSPDDSCRLLILNLFSYVINPFTSEAYFDYEKFYEDSKIAQRFMDDIVDLELEAIQRIIDKVRNDPEPSNIKIRELELWENIKKACENGRRTGTGITALGDVIAALGLKYGSDKSIDLSVKIYQNLKLACYRSSVDMAQELGPFPVWDFKLEQDNPFLLRIKEEDWQLYEDMKKYGRRNIAILTTAPTGSVSIETQTSSGIEPVFMVAYKRRKKINPSEAGARIDFTDSNGDNWQEFEVYHSKVKTWMEITGETDWKKSPYFEATAEEIDWKQRVKLQAEVNKHVDHAISSTINLPNDVSEEKVAEIYETAWKLGCKGITVYRAGCRDGVLVSSDKKEEKQAFPKTTALKRPEILDCDIHNVICGGKKFFVVVSFLDERPYEVFSGYHYISGKPEIGAVVKRKRGHYTLFNEEGDVLIENLDDYCEDDQEAILRLVSTSLRHGADISFVVHQLEKIKGTLHSFAKCLARQLKKYIPDGTEVTGEACNECNGKVIRSGGCSICSDCGWGKC